METFIAIILSSLQDFNTYYKNGYPGIVHLLIPRPEGWGNSSSLSATAKH